MSPSRKRDASAKHGQKRKRSSAWKPTPKQESQAEVIAKKLHHGIHEVRKAAKKAETFELRKLVKRLKAARSNSAKGNVKGDDPAEMERQLEVLKHANHEQFGNTALRTRVLKDGLLSKNEGVKAAVEEKLPESSLVGPQEPGSSAAKIHARLLSSKILADAVHAAVDTLKEVLNPSLAKAKGDKPEEESEEESEEEEVDDDEDISPAVHPRKGKKKAGLVDPEDDEESGSEAEVDDAGWESGTVDGGETDEGAGWESGSVDEGGHIAVANESDEGSDDDSDEDDDGDDDSDAEESGLDSDAPPPKKAKSSGKEARTQASADGMSTFLPSLAVGYTRGDSDASDISDGEGAAADAPRKNRRGQRARRAIWEKKYGRNANHVKTQQQQNPRQQHQPHQKPGRPHGARDERGGRRAGNGKFAASTVRPGRATLTGSNAIATASGARPTREPLPRGAPANWRPGVERDGQRSGGGYVGSGTQGEREKPLHPSWAAKKKLKEKQNPGIVAAQGKKITFS